MSSLASRLAPARHPEALVHLFLWSFLLAERWVDHYANSDKSFLFGVYQTLSLIIALIMPVYINALVLIPRYLKRAKWLRYGMLLLVLLLLASLFRGALTVLYFEALSFDYSLSAEFLKWSFKDYASFDRFVFGPTALIIWLSFAYRLIKDWVMHERIRTALEKEKVSMELAFLKSQVDPHFLFNTLNNIYALALEEKADRTADGVAKMGTLMRYSLHDSQADSISLEKELAYIEKYIELQRIRIDEVGKVSLHVNLSVSSLSDERIAPMMLLPFIENAFKYGVSAVDPSFIAIDLKLEKSVLTLLVKNTVHEKKEAERGGIGLKNVQSRLRLLYPEQHRLECNRGNNVYTVDLELNLKHD